MKRLVSTRRGRLPGHRSYARSLSGTGSLVSRIAGALGLLLAAAGCEPAHEAHQPIRVVRILGEPGKFPSQFGYPRAIDFDGRRLWVIDKSARVQQIDPKTGLCGLWWTMPDYELGMPTGVSIAPAAGPDGTPIPAIYIPDTHYHRVMVYALPDETPEKSREYSPTLLASFGKLGSEPGTFIYPTDVAVLTNEDGSAVERIYVSEYGGNDRISVFDSSYQFLFSFGVLGDGLDPSALEFSRPQSMVIDRARRELLVADACNQRVGRFTLDGELLGWTGSPTPERTDATVRLDFPYSLCLLEDSTVLVTEFGACRVQRLDLERGVSLGSFGEAGRGEGGLATPWASVVIGRETFILDSGNSRVVVGMLPGVEGGPS